MKQANSIDDVVTILDEIVAECERTGSRLGYFAALYRTVTLVVRQRCDEGFFNDNERMRRLDTIFANRYFAAYFSHQDQSGIVTQSWGVAFERARRRHLMILQQLLLGMNAHIDLDLGIATEEVSEGVLTDELREDFNRLNIILASLVETVQEQVVSVSPLLKIGDQLAGRLDEDLVDWGINLARDNAWGFARSLSGLGRNDKTVAIQKRDGEVALVGHIISSNRWFIAPIAWIIAFTEPGDVRRVIAILSGDDLQQAVQQRTTALAAQAALD